MMPKHGRILRPLSHFLPHTSCSSMKDDSKTIQSGELCIGLTNGDRRKGVQITDAKTNQQLMKRRRPPERDLKRQQVFPPSLSSPFDLSSRDLFMGGKGGSLSVKLQVITEVMGHNITEQGKQHIQS